MSEVDLSDSGIGETMECPSSQTSKENWMEYWNKSRILQKNLVAMTFEPVSEVELTESTKQYFF